MKHGHRPAGKKSRTYQSWSQMRQRCSNPRATGYRHYGGRGITVCPEWDSFEQFLADMGERPEGKSLERVDNDKNYCPENCCWATKPEQNDNRRYLGRKDQVQVELDGQIMDAYAAGKLLGIDHTTVRWRLKHWGRVTR